MSTVNKYNYEAVLLDFAEGRLSASETDALFDFLAAHPELQEDFDAALQLFSIPEDEMPAFSAKNALLQDENLDAKQNLIIAQLENVATDKESQKLQDLLKDDPITQKEYAIFSKMKLEEDERIVFAGKTGLIQTVSISYAVWMYRATYAAAAVILLLLAINGLDFRGNSHEFGLASNVLPKWKLPVKIDPIPSLIEPKEFIQEKSGAQKDKQRLNPGDDSNNFGVEQYASNDTYTPIQAMAPRDIQLGDLSTGAELAEYVPVVFDEPSDFIASPNFMERIANESNAIGFGYGFAENMVKKAKLSIKEYSENDYIDLRFWKVHTQIRKPSWMKWNRR